MVTACIYCDGPLAPVIGYPHWRECSKCSLWDENKCPIAADIARNYVLVRKPNISTLGRPGWAGR